MAKEFKITRSEGVCKSCQKPFSPGENIVALVKMGNDELLREDYHLGCWVEPTDKSASTSRDLLGVWRTRIPMPQEKKKLLIDDDLLINFFERLGGEEDECRIGLRYVLALILMRKKLLVYEGSTKGDDGRDLWKMRFKRSDQIHEVIDPNLDEDSIARVSSQLGQIMEGDFA